MGFLVPPDKRIFFDMLELVKRHNVDAKISLGCTPKELLQKTKVDDLEEEVTKIMAMVQSPEPVTFKL